MQVCVCVHVTHTYEDAYALLSEVRERVRAEAGGCAAYESGRTRKKYQNMRGVDQARERSHRVWQRKGGGGEIPVAEEEGRARLFFQINKARCPILLSSLQPLCSRSGSPDMLSISLSQVSLAWYCCFALARASGAGLRPMVAEGTYVPPHDLLTVVPAKRRGFLIPATPNGASLSAAPSYQPTSQLRVHPGPVLSVPIFPCSHCCCLLLQDL